MKHENANLSRFIKDLPAWAGVQARSYRVERAPAAGDAAPPRHAHFIWALRVCETVTMTHTCGRIRGRLTGSSSAYTVTNLCKTPVVYCCVCIVKDLTRTQNTPYRAFCSIICMEQWTCRFTTIVKLSSDRIYDYKLAHEDCDDTFRSENVTAPLKQWCRDLVATDRLDPRNRDVAAPLTQKVLDSDTGCNPLQLLRSHSLKCDTDHVL